MPNSSASAQAASREAAAPAVTGSRLRYIDALRAIAALLVVWMHVSQTWVTFGGGSRGAWLEHFAHAFDVGRLGVVVFFVISGFVIPFSIRTDRPAPVATFLIKRMFRIYPAYWLSIPFSAWATWWLWGAPFGLDQLLVNFTLLQDLFGVRPAAGVYWTLFVELVFYLLCVFLLLANSLRNPTRIGAIALILAAVHTLAGFALWIGLPLNPFLVFLPLHLSLMLTGALIRFCIFERSASPAARRLLFAMLAYYLAIFPVAAVWARGLLGNYVVATAAGVLLFVVGTTILRIETRVTDWLGRISYSIYLFHVPVYYPLFWWILRQPAGSPWRSQHLAVYLLGSSVLTIAVAACVHRFVEQPGIQLGRRCADAWRRRVQRGASVDTGCIIAEGVGPVLPEIDRCRP